MLFYDEDGCIVTATGSANETRMAWEQNGENLTVFMSWMPGHMEYINRHRDRFEALWGDTDPDFFVFTLPEAVEKKLRRRARAYEVALLRARAILSLPLFIWWNLRTLTSLKKKPFLTRVKQTQKIVIMLMMLIVIGLLMGILI